MDNRPDFQTEQFFSPPVPIPGIRFRLARGEDLPALYENCYPEMEWERFEGHYRYLLRWQENGRCYILVAETAEIEEKESSRKGAKAQRNSGYAIIVGSGQLIPMRDRAEIAELAVHPTYRKRGIGSAMIQILTGIAAGRKTSILEIGADMDNQAALRLYRRLGFGRDRLMRLPSGEKAIILSKRLTLRSESTGDFG